MPDSLAAKQPHAVTRSPLPVKGKGRKPVVVLNAATFQQRRSSALAAVGRRDWAEAQRLMASLREDPRFGTDDGLVLSAASLHLGQFDQAYQAAAAVLEKEPDNAKAAHSATVALISQNCWAQALPLFEAHRHGPAGRHYHFLLNHGTTLSTLGHHQAAMTVLLDAMVLEVGDPVVHMRLGMVLRDLKLFEESAESFRTALTLDPRRMAARLMTVHMRQHACQWDGFEAGCADIVSALASDTDIGTSLGEGGVFTLVALEQPPMLFKQATQQVAARYRRAQPLPRRPVLLAPGRRIRIGYVSNDYYNHATALLFVESLEQRNRDRFEVVLYSHSRSDGSAIEHRVRAACEHFVDISDLSDEQAARRIHADEVDLLVDLKGHTHGNRLGIFGWRPAPLQVSFLGFPGTTGADYIDYLIGDRWVTPLSHAERYTECLAQMPGSYQPNDSRRQRPPTMGRAEAGLPASGFVFASFNQAFKFTPEAFGVWMRILQAVPGSVLWLLQDNPQATKNLRREAQARGVDPDRLVFAPRLPYHRNLSRQPLADLMLDNWPCNAHTTASDALWMGVPMVTVCGEGFSARVAASLLSAVGLEQLVCHSPDDYEALVVSLARDPARLQALRQHLETERLRCGLFDGARHAADLEQLYLQMLERASAGLPPQTIAAPLAAAAS